jgi:endonuclease/exonuclease/phosphatase family metal-dependent hydrolase
LLVRLRLATGAEIDVYNTHLEAGPTERSVATRRSQLDELARGVERLSADRAVIAAGDFNVAFIRPGDREMLLAFRERLGLADSGAAPEIPFWRERDFVLYRSGGDVRLAVESAGEATEFVGRRRALSDHAALRVRFRAEVLAP